MRSIAILFFALVLAGEAEAGLLGWVKSERRSWQFVQDTGGIRIGAVREVSGRKVLPVEYDVSGLTTITRKPRSMNSGLSVRKVAAALKGGSLVIQVFTQAVDGKGHARHLHFADLSDIAPGNYEVFYETVGDPRKRLGRIELK